MCMLATMDKEIIQQLQCVKLAVEEEESTEVDEKDMCKGLEDCVNSCVGRLCLAKEFPVRILQLLVRKVWCMEKLRAVKIWTNVVQIFFPDLEGMEKILKGVLGVLIITYWRYKGGTC